MTPEQCACPCCACTSCVPAVQTCSRGDSLKPRGLQNPQCWISTDSDQVALGLCALKPSLRTSARFALPCPEKEKPKRTLPISLQVSHPSLAHLLCTCFSPDASSWSVGSTSALQGCSLSLFEDDCDEEAERWNLGHFLCIHFV